MRQARVLLPLVTLALISAGAATAEASKPAPAATTPAPAKVMLPDMVKGNPKAKITVVEYGSATCGHCAAWYNENFAKFDKTYIATGKVKYVFREVITPPAELDYALYLLARCASVAKSPKAPDSNAYFSIVDGFWAVQSKVYASGDIRPTLDTLTKQAGLTPDATTACLKDQKALDALESTMEANLTKDNVESTPTFFVNGTRVAGHEMSDIEAAIASASPSKAKKR
jgi:protein-disulfide isomerase